MIVNSLGSIRPGRTPQRVIRPSNSWSHGRAQAMCALTRRHEPRRCRYGRRFIPIQESSNWKSLRSRACRAASAHLVHDRRRIGGLGDSAQLERTAPELAAFAPATIYSVKGLSCPRPVRTTRHSTPQQPRETALAPYCEVVLWRRRFYMALVAALFAVVALAVICTGRQ